ncbi:hypothetical protein WH221_00835 [Chryseobacterium culicis]|uniref:Knr4/Smi1-like domain-containing protein n=1 Tax=Chryseobacterium culicis TaxID=680127 RepID=A0A2S9CWJ5_CHRCI|nr:hypothetical protein [Chryseobacterium culicis]PRB84841.1 hypothetical protein CQ022_00785 [Chryseobacterium culicis]PRB87760.1 hypothetical protein CQ033_20090 [Chryseobacterium culicis]
MDIPSNLTEFLYWVKESTEKLWSVDDENCPKGFYNARWQGLSEEEIDQVERKYEVSFTSEHREFLKILHAIDKKEIVEYEYEGELITEECIFFYNWLENEEEITAQTKYFYKGIWNDVIDVNHVWLKSWGIKPKSIDKKKQIFDEWFSKLPQLLPVRDSAYVVSNENLKWNPVIGGSGSGIVIVGWDFRTYLLYELREHLNIYTDVYDEEDERFYPELIDEVQKINNENFKYDESKDIPYLKEMILYWSSGWSSFGLSYHPENARVHPIVKTYIAEEEK